MYYIICLSIYFLFVYIIYIIIFTSVKKIKGKKILMCSGMFAATVCMDITYFSLKSYQILSLVLTSSFLYTFFSLILSQLIFSNFLTCSRMFVCMEQCTLDMAYFRLIIIVVFFGILFHFFLGLSYFSLLFSLSTISFFLSFQPLLFLYFNSLLFNSFFLKFYILYYL